MKYSEEQNEMFKVVNWLDINKNVSELLIFLWVHIQHMHQADNGVGVGGLTCRSKNLYQ